MDWTRTIVICLYGLACYHLGIFVGLRMFKKKLSDAIDRFSKNIREGKL